MQVNSYLIFPADFFSVVVTLSLLQDEEMAGGERTWAFMKEMGQVMKHFRGPNVNKLKSRASPEFLCKSCFQLVPKGPARVVNFG